jgi:hypothetical protein
VNWRIKSTGRGDKEEGNSKRVDRIGGVFIKIKQPGEEVESVWED